MAHVHFSSGPVAPCSTAIDKGYPPAVANGKPRDSRITHAEKQPVWPAAAPHTKRLPAIAGAVWRTQMVANKASARVPGRKRGRLNALFNLCSYPCRPSCWAEPNGRETQIRADRDQRTGLRVVGRFGDALHGAQYLA